ncbi:hypothetical protein [Coraliomargarita parva]|uniref:hypothetical protein n=1 Tax=Coraliomargarita parva TaxID=3014050 RepID=UPI0022B3C02C|nr:hypothetical protein [Coraliomargarita parva]
MTAPGSHKLYHGEDRFAWHALRWPAFSAFAESQGIAILPVYSIADWALGRPLDVEEVLGACLLDRALQLKPDQASFRVLPPLRITPRQSCGTCFGMDIEAAHRVLEETIVSASACGVRRFVLFNTSPFLEEWIDVAARDLRVTHDLQVFCVNLSGLGLDFHPQRSGDRSLLQKILTELLGSDAEPEPVYSAGELDPVPELMGPAEPLQIEAGVTVVELLSSLAEDLSALLGELVRHPPLAESSPDAGGES